MNPSGRRLLPIIPAMIVGLVAVFVLFPRPPLEPSVAGYATPADPSWVLIAGALAGATYVVGFLALRRRQP